MEKIPEKFKKNTIYHELLKRKGNVVLYVQKSKEEGEIIGYEVQIVTIQKEGKFKFKKPDGSYKEAIFKKKEKLASNQEFGRLGWSCLTLAQAETVFKQQVELSKQNGK